MESTNDTNVLLLLFLQEILGKLDILAALFQSSESTLSTSLRILASVREKLAATKEKYSTVYISNLVAGFQTRTNP